MYEVVRAFRIVLTGYTPAVTGSIISPVSIAPENVIVAMVSSAPFFDDGDALTGNRFGGLPWTEGRFPVAIAPFVA